MAALTTLFWDIGGVMLTNAWGRDARAKAIEHFDLKRDGFEERHGLVRSVFETGQMDLDDYLERTVFDEARSFTPATFKAFMFEQSQPLPGTLALVERVARTKRWLMATINNESTALNQHRIDRFELTRYFTAFFSSCFLGVEKPDQAIYEKALQMTQRSASESLFIDDRAPNVECARRLGMQAIHYHSAQQLESELRASGVDI